MLTEVFPTTTIIYEQPLNDSTRICLRLEHLFKQVNQSLSGQTVTESRHALISLVKCLDVIDRPDIKSKLTQAMTQSATSLAELNHSPHIDLQKLDRLLKQLDQLVMVLHHNHERIGAKLNNNDFLNQIRTHLRNPGGACNYTIPALLLWLAKPASERIADLHQWTQEYKELQEIVTLILSLVRESSCSQQVRCNNGFYHQTLDPNLPCQMIRAAVATNYNVYPEFSVGRHRLTIRFLEPSFHYGKRANQSKQTIEFDLTCCRI